ncbi:Protein LURP-one-related 15 [Linum grandiflorum]
MGAGFDVVVVPTDDDPQKPLANPVVVVGPQYLADYPVDLTVASTTLTLGENDFTIKDINGTVIFNVKSKLLSLHDRRRMHDSAGNVVLSLQQKILSAHRRWQAFKGDSTDAKDLIFSVRKSSILKYKGKLDVFLAENKKEESPDFRIKGGWAEGSCTVYLGKSKTVIAKMQRGQSLKVVFLDADTFKVTVYPQVDYAFIVALVVILDEINADRSGDD